MCPTYHILKGLVSITFMWDYIDMQLTRIFIDWCDVLKVHFIIVNLKYELLHNTE